MAKAPPAPAPLPEGYKVPGPLPEANKSFMTPRGWDNFFSLMDALLPSVTSTSRATDHVNQIILPDDEFAELVKNTRASMTTPPSEEDLIAYLEYRLATDQGFIDDLTNTLCAAAMRGQIASVMNLLDTRPICLAVTGHWRAPCDQPVRVREKILRGWASGRLAPLKVLVRSFSVLAQKANCCVNPWFSTMNGWTDLPSDWKPRQPNFDYEFQQPPAGAGPVDMTTDVVIVGSGCGGGVSAKNLAEAGHKVLVVDKGYHFTPDFFPMKQSDGIYNLFDNRGLMVSDDSSVTLVAGSTWGGGGTINWSVSLKLQQYVRDEWASRGLPLFKSKEWDACVDRVCEGAGVTTDSIRHNPNCSMVLDGCKKLGWHSEAAPQNSGGKEHYCGRCHLGCGLNEKRGPAVAWLPDAARAGAQFMEGFKVEKVTFAADGVTATGIEGTWNARSKDGVPCEGVAGAVTRTVRIKAKKVIVSGGSIQSPALLLRSGVKNPQVGKHLYLHPAMCVTAIVDEEQKAWEGGIITAYSSEFENLDGKGHGVKLETMCMVPYTAMAAANWVSGPDAKLHTTRYSNMRGLLSITRDRDQGRVYLDPKTRAPRIEYTESAFDAEHTLDGMEAVAKAAYVMGAKEIRPLLPNVLPFVVAVDGDPKVQASLPEGKDPEFADAKFGAWLKKMRKVGNRAPVAGCLSAHQMGSCRMSAKAADGVVDPSGKVWGCENLYVADASVFPSASGVNPMITAMSLADYISRTLVKTMAA